MNDSPSAVWLGHPYPLGASWDGEGVNFALFSEHAEKVELCLFDNRGRRETERVRMHWQTHKYSVRNIPGYISGIGLRWLPNKKTGLMPGFLSCTVW